MDKESSQTPEKEDKKPAKKGRKILKILRLGCIGLVVVIILFIAVGLTLTKLNPTYTDYEGTAWQKYEGDKSTPAFTVFTEQDGTSESGMTVVKINIDSECDPAGSGTQYLYGDFTKGVERPNHCVISNDPEIRLSTDPILDYYLLLSDGSIISLDGTVANKIQVNVNSDGINIIQSEGTAYYRIQKQPEGKQFTIQMGPETYTATGTELMFQAANSTTTAAARNYKAAVINGSVQVRPRKIPNWTSGIRRKLAGSKSEEDDGVVIKENQKAVYTSRITTKLSYTITPIDMVSTDKTDRFTQKQMIIFAVIFIKDMTFDKIKSGIQQIMADTLSTHQAAVDKLDAWREEIRNAPSTGSSSIWGNSSGDSSSSGSSSGSSGTGTDRCSQIPSAVHVSLMQSCNHRYKAPDSDKSDWLYCIYSDGNAGFFPPECVPAGVPVN
jgi:hypothetical protein